MTRDDHSSSTDGIDRRNALRTIGVAGTSIAGVGSLTGVANATEAGSNMYICPPGGCSGGGGGGGGFLPDLNVIEIADNVSPGELCGIIVSGCVAYTALAAADIVPGDERVLGASCAVGGFGCVLYNAFKDEHGSQPAQVCRVRESAGGMDAWDYVVVPAQWGWTV